MGSTASDIRKEIICPNCWHRFAPERVLFVARHENLVGDLVAGPSAYRRFLPSRFTAMGDALDANGLSCHQLACPRCHLVVSRPLLELSAYFVSIVGAPASGKSYVLAAMTWQLRSILPKLGLLMADGDPAANQELQRYEELLFMNNEPDKPIALRKTETQSDELYQTITLDGQPQTFPRPFIFTLSPKTDGRRQQLGLILYDNAGEHFLPGADSTATPTTLHIAESAATMFLYDPTQDPRFRERCRRDDPQIQYGVRPGAGAASGRQEIILSEMIARVRRYKGLSQAAKHRRPLVMVLAKADVWLPEGMLAESPLVEVAEENGTEGKRLALSLDRIEQMSEQCRQILQEACPEVVSAAEDFSERVIYIPVSALGCSPERVGDGDAAFYGIRPERIAPRWVTAPLLWALAQSAPGFIPTT